MLAETVAAAAVLGSPSAPGSSATGAGTIAPGDLRRPLLRGSRPQGAWYRVLDRSGQRYDDKKSPPSKTDYHPLGACYEILRSLSAAG